MTVVSTVYPTFKGAQQGSGAYSAIDMNADPLYIMLVLNTYQALAQATADAHDFRNDVTAYESSGTNYTAGGVALTSLTLTLSGDDYIFDAADASWAAATITARGAIIFKRVGADLSTPADDPLICYLDFGADKVSTDGTFQVVFNAGGIIAFT